MQRRGGCGAGGGGASSVTPLPTVRPTPRLAGGAALNPLLSRPSRPLAAAPATCHRNPQIDAKKSVPQEMKPKARKVFVGGLSPDTSEGAPRAAAVGVAAAGALPLLDWTLLGMPCCSGAAAERAAVWVALAETAGAAAVARASLVQQPMTYPPPDARPPPQRSLQRSSARSLTRPLASCRPSTPLPPARRRVPRLLWPLWRGG